MDVLITFAFIRRIFLVAVQTEKRKAVEDALY
jgi:hypothetical protein